MAKQGSCDCGCMPEGKTRKSGTRTTKRKAAKKKAR